MSEKDLVKELKAEIVEITKDRDDALDKVKGKESRMKLCHLRVIFWSMCEPLRDSICKGTKVEGSKVASFIGSSTDMVRCFNND